MMANYFYILDFIAKLATVNPIIKK